MRNYSIIAKGIYSYKQTNEFLPVERFLIIRKKSRRFLLLDFDNRRDEKLTGLTLQIEQFDVRGNELGIVNAIVKDLSVKKGKFILKQKIELHHSCIDFRVKIVTAEYGNYVYRLGADDTFVTYERKKRKAKIDDTEISHELGADGVRVKRRRFGIPVFTGIFAGILLATAAVTSYFHIMQFKEDEERFFLSNLQYEFMTDKEEGSPVEIVGLIGLGADNIVIPNEVEGHPVVKVRSGAFANSKVIKRLTVESGVVIESSAFENCPNLQSVVIKGENTISQSAFYNCDALESVDITNITEIGMQAFASCESLSSIRIVNTNEEETLTIAPDAFSGVRNLSSIYIDQFIAYGENCCYFSGASSVDSLFLKNYNYAPYEIGSVELGTVNNQKPLKALFGNGYLPTKVKDLRIEYTDGIPNSFMENCATALESVKIDNLTSSVIGEKAFRNCSKLQSVSFPKAITVLGAEAFAESGIKSFNASSLTQMGEGAFHNCSALAGVSLKDGTQLTNIPKQAFSGCGKLKTITIPQKVSSIGEEAFSDCKSLEKVNFSQTASLQMVGDLAFYGCEALRKIELPQGLLNLSNGLFGDCINLRYLSIPQSVSEISVNAFENCYRLYEIENLSSYSVSNSAYTLAIYRSVDEARMERRTFDGGVLANANGKWYMIEYTQQRTTVTTPDGVDGATYQIVPYLFYKTNDVSAVNISTYVSKIGDRAFTECKVKEVNFSYGVGIDLTLGGEVFKENSSLTSINFGNRKLTYLPVQTFYQCTKLTAVDLPVAIATIGAECFFECSALKSVYLPNDLQAIENCAFANCSSLENVIGGNSRLNKVGSRAFEYCTALKEIGLPNCVETIADYAYNGCTSLVGLSLPTKLKTIEANAFAGCSALETVTLFYNVENIGADAFLNCKKLHEVYNYSSLDLQKDSLDNGGVAYNALVIHTNNSVNSYPLNTLTLGDFVFKGHSNYGWYLIGYNGSAEHLTLDAVNADGYYISSYGIARYALENNNTVWELTIGSAVTGTRSGAFTGLGNLCWVKFSNPSSNFVLTDNAFVDCYALYCVIIPTSLRGISANAFGVNIGDVYYEGTETQWTRYSSRYLFSYGSLYYYNNCVHSYGYWKYVDGNVSTEIKNYDFRTITEPTCTRSGRGEDYCNDCGYVQSVTLSPKGHTWEYYYIDSCVVCNYLAETELNANVYSKLGKYISITNDKNLPFDIFESNRGLNRIYSTNEEADSTATLVFTANRNITLSFTCVLAGNGNSVTVTAKGTNETTYSGSKNYTKTLAKGETVTVTYTKRYKNENNYIYLTNIRLYSVGDE